jgi:hypothetical protein
MGSPKEWNIEKNDFVNQKVNIQRDSTYSSLILIFGLRKNQVTVD